MKYCPNPACPHRQRSAGPAEFVDTASVCNDCGIVLVTPEALGADETRAAVEAFHAKVRDRIEARVDDGTAPIEDAAPGRIDFIMAGVYFLAAGGIVYLNGGLGRIAGVVLAIFFGVRRILRGLEARRAAKARAVTDPA
jgi:hypothetical protein